MRERERERERNGQGRRTDKQRERRVRARGKKMERDRGCDRRMTLSERRNCEVEVAVERVRERAKESKDFYAFNIMA